MVRAGKPKGQAMKHYDPGCVHYLMNAGITCDDANALRRISMTLHRWHELECGDSNAYGSWCITRGTKHRDVGGKAVFIHDDDDGKPYLERHPYSGMVSYEAIPDRERGARKRLDKIMARYPGFATYIQGDPRGCALYVLRPGDVRAGEDVSSIYTRGIAVYK
jgi:hypothetical protein